MGFFEILFDSWTKTEHPPRWLTKRVNRLCKSIQVSDRIFYFAGRHRKYKVVFGSPKYQGYHPDEEYYYKNRN